MQLFDAQTDVKGISCQNTNVVSYVCRLIREGLEGCTICSLSSADR